MTDPFDDVPGINRRRGWWLANLVWAGFAAAPMVTFLGDGHGALEVGVVLAAWLAFCALFVVAMVRLWDRDVSTDVVPLVAALIALTVLLIAVGGTDFIGMAIFSAVAAGRRLPPRMAWVVIAALAAGAGIVLAATGDDGNGVAIALTTLGLGWWMMGFTRLITTVRELHAARAEIARLAVAEERERFSRDLHDLLGHSLSLIALKSELAGRYLPERPEQAAAEVADITDVSRRALSEVREAVGGYRRPTLAAELAGAREALGAAGIALRADEVPAELPADAEAVLAWAVREGTTNVLRHAAARSVEIRLHADADAASVEVVDDGRGADDTAVDDGSGLAGLADRISRHGGHLDAAPRAEGGFRLAASVPFKVAV
jgi:two-component system, NarL family, sensor histidine kinase DesK